MAQQPSDAKMSKRRVYVVRHAEREDNINRQWQLRYPGMYKDNSPLSDRGRRQAEDLRKYFRDIPIDAIFVSPFDRTMETASILLGDHPNDILVEPGLCEVLYLCKKPQPSFWPVEQLKQKFPRVASDYNSIFRLPMPREGLGDEACIPRLRQTIDGILKRYPDSRNIVLVSHGASIAAIHDVLINEFSYVGQATVSIFDETAPQSQVFNCIQSSGTSHLSQENRQNLRAY